MAAVIPRPFAEMCRRDRENAPLDTQVGVSGNAASVGEAAAELQEGDVLTLEEALSALLVPSGNDAAVAIAETVGALMDPEGGYDAFIAAMNAKAAELGCVDTVFTNPCLLYTSRCV